MYYVVFVEGSIYLCVCRRYCVCRKPVGKHNSRI
jgi:hypothetical protein